ncbi:hypothetical protein PISL3812_06820 [Talaromyces islandicus]|uniref:Uncharacterized protein n=1 Tax=Talaromyces islandicus TaxID=28573 RepID=A0A0U1M440_TALIS|nr:hypothetical protein PISL3812_06820 [Talaromyces islandicus]
MPPKKSDNKSTNPAPTENAIKPEDADFFLQCLKAFGSDGAMDLAVVSVAIGHTNVTSTRNTFARLKKKWGFGNIPVKSAGRAAKASGGGQDGGSVQDDVLKSKSSTGKVVKKRAAPKPKSKTSKAALEKEHVRTEEDAGATDSDVNPDDVSEEDA